MAGTIFLPYPAIARSIRPKKGFIGLRASPYFQLLDDKGTIQCLLCPRKCLIIPDDRGFCEVRENRGGRLYSLVYGNPCAVHIDPIEKKPFYHVLPGTRSFSIATAGCNFDCKFCQNWEISQVRPEETYNYELSPEDILFFAKKMNCRSIASTYVEPTIFFEYMLDIAKLCKKEQGILKVYHSNGYINPRPLNDLIPYLDAACIDLKSISEDFYGDICEGELYPVLDTLKLLSKHKVHIEIVNLVIPTKNDSKDDITNLCKWIYDNLGPFVPLHFSRFFPRYKLKNLPPTPISTLKMAYKTAKEIGIKYVYLGNIPADPTSNTYCHNCNQLLIERKGYFISRNLLIKGKCPKCGTKIPGIWT